MSTTPNPQRPTVQRLRLRYAKRGRLRFTSHRDIQRVLERALRRAEVPMAYSQGFSPHPKVSYAGAAPTGCASEAEYLELGVTDRCDPDALRAALDEALPSGIDVLEVVEARTGPLADQLTASSWRLELPGVEPTALASAVARFLASQTVEVQRRMKDGVRTLDARAAVVSLESSPDRPVAAAGEPPCATLDLVVRHGTPAVRPDDVLAGLRRAADLETPAPARVTRLAQGPLDVRSGSVGDPLAPDRDATRTGSADAAAPGTPAGA